MAGKSRTVTYPTPPSMLSAVARDAVVNQRRPVTATPEEAAAVATYLAENGYEWPKYGDRWHPNVTSEFTIIHGEGDWLAEIRINELAAFKHEPLAGKLLAVVAGLDVVTSTDRGNPPTVRMDAPFADIYDDDHDLARAFRGTVENATTTIVGRSITLAGWLTEAYAYSPQATRNDIATVCLCTAQEAYGGQHYYSRHYLPPAAWQHLLPAPVQIRLMPMRRVKLADDRPAATREGRPE